MSKVLKEITCVTGEYKNAQGEVKKRYTRIGSIIDTKNGAMLKLDTIPLKEGGWDGWAYLNDPKKEEGQERKPVRQAKHDFDEDVPF